MKLITYKVEGTKDILPSQSYKWQFVEDIMKGQADSYGFKEIRTPVFEHTELFNRSVGETTDVVQKEMYTFTTKGDKSITLRPEGTAGAARAILENGVYNDGYPIKAYYITSCYRYEKNQAGRQREFHQFGMEVYGADSYFADAEVICAANSIFDRLGIQNIKLEINSIGCPNCRKDYNNALKAYFTENKDCLCETCLSRLDRNPMRILDCKNEKCSEIAAKAPTVLDYICGDCSAHFEGVKKCLDSVDLKYTVNPKIVRGLDYYTKTVFEFISDDIGAQSTVCGGGRYDKLIEELGGKPTPSLGFGMGIERLMMVMDAQGVEVPKPPECDLYIASFDEKSAIKAFELVQGIRDSSLIAECDIVGRSIRSQMKYADKINAKFVIVIGEDELKENKAKIRNMKTHAEKEIPLDENFFEKFFEIYVNNGTFEIANGLDLDNPETTGNEINSVLKKFISSDTE